MYRHASHRNLKNRALKRRVTFNHYTPKRARCDCHEYDRLQLNQIALNKLKYEPQLVVTVLQAVKTKQKEQPSDPPLLRWQQLLNALVEGECTIEAITEEVMGYDDKAKQLRNSTILDCLVD